ncbi:Velvet factor [Coniochaeta hoffmannii]|uniref:Velvet factor n=1 Tax=Coniochaeta hoffmannii TaxID=91930 RepID=A0AA38RMY8_9PEZI|nr:Velvet factor [Coniochaeta hoffmannii]
MARPLNAWHQDTSAPRAGAYYPREQHTSQPPRLPSMASIISTATQGHARDTYSSKGSYYSDYATPSPVGQTPPQLPLASSDPPPMPRRPAADVRLSPAQSSVASDRSDEYQDMMRMRQGGREYAQAAHMPRLYPAQTRLRHDTFQHQEGHPPQGLFGKLVPGSTGPNEGPPPAPRQLHSPPTPQASTSPRQEAMSISNILSDSAPSRTVTKAPVRSPTYPAESGYKITVRQQPFAARSCGFGERDRRVIDPPPIVQLTVDDPDMSPEEITTSLRDPFLVVHCSIWDETGTKDMSSMPEDFRQQRRLMGTLVGSPFVGLDEDGEEGCFFCFPDLSCRTPGTFRLQFQFIKMDPFRMKVPGYRAPVLSTAVTDAFQVFNAKDFPGMRASTALTKKLKEQGCLISIKKGNDKTTASHGRDESDDDDDDDRDSRKRGKKQRRH